MAAPFDIYCDYPGVAGSTMRTGTATVGGFDAGSTMSGVYSSVLGGPMPLGVGPGNNNNDADLSTIVMGENNCICGVAATPAGCYNSILNGLGNTASGYYSSIFNGACNCAMQDPNSCFNDVYNGLCNTILDNCFATIVNGNLHDVKQEFSTTMNGVCNISDNKFSYIGTGEINLIYGNVGYNSIFNGCNNTTSGYYMTILNGYANQALGSGRRHNTVVSGANNIAGQDFSFVGSGGDDAFVAGGNQATGIYSFIGNGTHQRASGRDAFIGSGEQNTVSVDCSAVVGGCCNTVDAICSTVGGGGCNLICSKSSFIGGGDLNFIDAPSLGFPANNTIAGGHANTIVGSASPAFPTRQLGFIGGGNCNIISASAYGTILGGDCNNLLAVSTSSAIMGGVGNTISAYSECAFIGGGDGNIICSNCSAIGGGIANVVQAEGSSIFSGRENQICVSVPFPSGRSFLGAGACNFICESCSSIAGGCLNQVLGPTSFIGGGQCNYLDACSNRASIFSGFGNEMYTNQVTKNNMVIFSGRQNITCNHNAFIGSGANNIVHGDSSYIGSGHGNCIYSDQLSTISNGSDNCICNYPPLGLLNFMNDIGSGVENRILSSSIDALNNFIGNGCNNRVTDSSYSFMGNGCTQLIRGTQDVFLGNGFENAISCCGTVLVGGSCNIVIGMAAVIGNGSCNSMDALSSFMGNGYCNCVEQGSDYSALVGGCCNTIYSGATCSILMGGSANLICKSSATLGGGFGICVDGAISGTFSGYYNCVLGDCSLTFSGSYGTVSAAYSVIMGGLCGAICCSDLSYIGGGFCNNLIPATSPIPGNVIFGGECNGPIQDDPLYNVITGGHANRMGCYLSALAGACGNYMDGGFSAVLGGSNNTVSSNYTYAAVQGQGVSAVSNNTLHVECFNFANVPNITGPPAGCTVAHEVIGAWLPTYRIMVIR